MTNVHVNPGICGLETDIHLSSDDLETALIEMTSACPHIKAMAEELKEIDGYTECFAKIGDSEIYRLAGIHCKHPGCPVPAAVIKGVEVVCGLALPKDAEIKIAKE